MATHKSIDRICAAAIVVALLLTAVFIHGEALGIQPASKVMGYESRLFDTSRVHTVDVVMDDWDGFLETCENEEYAACAVVIDGENYKNVGIRAKGNTSLSSVSSMGSDRYSFKIEFDQYDSAGSYHGLDKLCLNNLIQDNTLMKDYLVYQMMGQFGVAAPLCSYVYLTVNGEDWGLYLAVEGVEESFLQRNYGSDYGELYKPDSMSMGGGRGNGRDFDMEEFMGSGQAESGQSQEQAVVPQQDQAAVPSAGAVPEGFDPSAVFGGASGGQMPQMGGQDLFGGGMPEGFDPSAVFGGAGGDQPMDMPENFDASSIFGGFGGVGGFGGMGSSDVLLQYAGDDPDDYPNIFDSAKTDVSAADQARLIEALKALSEGDASAVDADAVIRYFVVHNFVVNGDSYTGSMVHNYYLYEEDGVLSMLPWDYNLAFGGFQAGDASAVVNDPIDTPLSVTGDGTHPVIDWIFASEAYTELYHQYFTEFLDTVDLSAMIEETAALIAPYVEKDPTKFCTVEEFETGVQALQSFCALRTESVRGQLSGAVPSTAEEQAADDSALVDASGLTLSDMGSMGFGGGMGGFPQGGGNGRGEQGASGGFPQAGGFSQFGGQGSAPPDGSAFPQP